MLKLQKQHKKATLIMYADRYRKFIFKKITTLISVDILIISTASKWLTFLSHRHHIRILDDGYHQHDDNLDSDESDSESVENSEADGNKSVQLDDVSDEELHSEDFSLSSDNFILSSWSDESDVENQKSREFVNIRNLSSVGKRISLLNLVDGSKTKSNSSPKIKIIETRKRSVKDHDDNGETLAGNKINGEVLKDTELEGTTLSRMLIKLKLDQHAHKFESDDRHLKKAKADEARIAPKLLPHIINYVF